MTWRAGYHLERKRDLYPVAWHRLIENTLFEEKVYVGYSLGESRWEKIANDRMRKKREGNETVYKEEEEELHKEIVPCILPSNQLKGLYKMLLGFFPIALLPQRIQ